MPLEYTLPLASVRDVALDARPFIYYNSSMKDDLEQIEEKIRKKQKERERKKKPKMKISGKSVFGLQRIIKKKK